MIWLIIAAVTAVWFMLMSRNKLSGIATYAYNAGFRGKDLIISVAIALAESSGDPNAQGDKDADGVYTSLGLWQIHWTVHPEFDKAQLFDPQYNANAAFTLYSRAGNSFRDWSTYTQNSPKTGVPYYLAHMDEAQSDVEVV